MTKSRFALLLGGLILGCSIGSAQNPYPIGPQLLPPQVTREASIDRHALAASKDVEGSLDALAQYLTRPAKNDRDKVRAIFRWMVDRIRYDVNAHLTNHRGEVQPHVVLRERDATAYGYANLFEALARRAGLEAVTLHGHAKMKHSTEDGGHVLKIRHAWNAVKADGAWQFVDVTWGSGYLKGQRWRRVVQEQYLLVAPTQMVLTHLPYDPRWQLLAVPVTPAQFDGMPVGDANFFNFSFKHQSEVRRVNTPDGRSSAVHSNSQLTVQSGTVKVLAAPPSQVSRGHDCYFVIEAIDVAQMAVWNNGRWVPLRKNGTRFEGGIRPEAGEMRLCLQRRQDQAMQTVVTYKVSEY